jgi:hypothetical protein
LQYQTHSELSKLSRKHKYALIQPTVQELQSLQVGLLLEISFQNRLSYLDKFGLYAYFQWRTGRAMNTKVLENFLTFLTVGKTQNFGLEEESYDQLKLGSITSYGFQV